MANTAAALHILVKHKEQAEDIIKQLKKGAKFQTLAKNIQLARLANVVVTSVSSVAVKWYLNSTKFVFLVKC